MFDTCSSATSKTRITIRLDTDVLDYIKESSEKYQTEINRILRAYKNYKERQDGEVHQRR